MPKAGPTDGNRSSEFEKNRSKLAGFIGRYGTFLIAWSRFETVVEIVVMRLLRLDMAEMSIVMTSLSFETKMNIACALLRRDPSDEVGVRLLRAARSVAERNRFVHGFLRVYFENLEIDLIRRDLGGTYKVTSKPLGADKITAHVRTFVEKLGPVEAHFGNTQADIDDYLNFIAAEAV